MRYIPFLIFIFPLITTGQAGLFTTYYENKKVKEVYEATGKHGEIKNGSYQKFHLNGNLLEKGFYLNNQKSGEWEAYYSGGRLKEQGKYNNDIKAGVWVYYDYDGRLLKKFNHDANQEIPITLDNYNFRISLTGYPAYARENEIEGDVMIAFDIDSTCRCSNFRIVSSTNEIFNNAATAAGRSLFDSIHKERNLICDNRTIELPVRFRLN